MHMDSVLSIQSSPLHFLYLETSSYEEGIFYM